MVVLISSHALDVVRLHSCSSAFQAPGPAGASGCIRCRLHGAMLSDKVCAAQVSGSYDTTVRFWNLDSLRCVRKCEGHEDAVRVLAVVNGKV